MIVHRNVKLAASKRTTNKQSSLDIAKAKKWPWAINKASVIGVFHPWPRFVYPGPALQFQVSGEKNMVDDNPFAIVARFMMPVIALTVGARLDAALERALLAKMRELSEAQRTNLFEGYGPLSSFAAKIDVAYALNIFDGALYADLIVIRKIRNAFAHK